MVYRDVPFRTRTEMTMTIDHGISFINYGKRVAVISSNGTRHCE
jgi:hypothetical protein